MDNHKGADRMRLQEAIEATAGHYIYEGQYPTQCDTRCMINDLIADEDGRTHRYNQEKAHRAVITLLRGY